MASSNVDEFGRCGCGGEIRLTWVEVRFNGEADNPANGRDVPQGRCSACGRRYYSAATLHALEHTFAAVILGDGARASGL